MHDGIGPVDDRREVVDGDVGLHPVHLRRVPRRAAPGHPDHDVHGRILAEEGQEAGADVAGGPRDDDAHDGAVPVSRRDHAVRMNTPVRG